MVALQCPVSTVCTCPYPVHALPSLFPWIKKAMKPHIVTVWWSRKTGRTTIWYYDGSKIYGTTPYAVCSCWSISISATGTSAYCRVLQGENIFVSWCWVDIWLSHQLSIPSVLEFILCNHYFMQKHNSCLFYSSSLWNRTEQKQGLVPSRVRDFSQDWLQCPHGVVLSGYWMLFAGATKLLWML
jgi:hypothetical protein